MRVAPREALCPAGKRGMAYAEAEIEYAPGLYLLRPRAIGKLLQALRPRPGDKALAICAPYGGQVLKQIGCETDELAADKTPAKGKYAVIVVEGAVDVVPASWTAALADGGRMAVIVRQGPMGKTRVYERVDGQIVWREVFDAAASFLPGHEPKAQFAF
jgi:protein-L-isoaspartate(D-aspartate) O-methyltransferase